MSRTIPALSLLQPWASLVAVGAKRIETRSWATKHRGILAIHASKGYPRECRDFAGQIGVRLYLPSGPLPLGRVVAVCRLVCIRPTDELEPALSARELHFGDYSPNRYGWLLEDVRVLPEPVEARGSLSLWQWECPDTVWGALRLEELAGKTSAPPLGGLFAGVAG